MTSRIAKHIFCPEVKAYFRELRFRQNRALFMTVSGNTMFRWR
jgi:hypothetical protein